ncbi:hypothetical protein N2152v2_003682 [Parachlorella kessleri]
MTKATVLVAGAAGTLGHKTCLSLSRLPDVKARGLVRSLEPTDPEKRKVIDDLKAAGVDLVEGDVMKAETLAKACEGVDVVVSTVLGPDEVFITGQGNLVEAAKAAGASKFVASCFSMDIFGAEPGVTSNPLIEVRRQFADTLKQSGIPSLHINMGVFMEVFWGFYTIWDNENKTLRFYGSPDTKVDVSTYDDVAAWTARAAVDDSITGVLEVVGEEISMNEVAAVWKEVKGEDIKLECLGSINDLKAEIVRQKTETPANWMSWVPLTYQYQMFGGPGKLKHVANDRFPDVKPTTMKEFLQANPDVTKVAWWP